jgi:hypothetical protein
VYNMFGSHDYRISDTGLIIPTQEIIPLTSESTRWKLIARIGNEWKAARKDLSNCLWVADPEGIVLDK